MKPSDFLGTLQPLLNVKNWFRQTSFGYTCCISNQNHARSQWPFFPTIPWNASLWQGFGAEHLTWKLSWSSETANFLAKAKSSWFFKFKILSGLRTIQHLLSQKKLGFVKNEVSKIHHFKNRSDLQCRVKKEPVSPPAPTLKLFICLGRAAASLTANTAKSKSF